MNKKLTVSALALLAMIASPAVYAADEDKSKDATQPVVSGPIVDETSRVKQPGDAGKQIEAPPPQANGANATKEPAIK